MLYPALSEPKTTRSIVEVFGGYNHNLRIADGEFFDMKNLCSDAYPLLSPRGKRGIYATPEHPSGLIAKDSLCYVDGADFVMNEYRVSMGLNDKPKTLISMGAYVIIMPDKKYINTANLSDFGNIDAFFKSSSDVEFKLCRLDGADYEDAVVQDTAPDPLENDLWIDTSETPHSLKQYSKSSAMWSTIGTTYIKISAFGIGENFNQYDGVTISGVEDEALSDLNASMIIWERGDNFIVVTGILDKITTQSAPITVERRMPEMDFVIESGNRLWGCRYGPALDGTIVNEIYASKLGDFKNWNCFMGISTDSYAASLGTDGQFTGAITHLGYPLFFKETCLHKIYGNYPANYQIQTTACRGVQKGCERSLAIVNEALFYKSRSGICVYDGSLPSEISYALGDVVYSGAVAGALGNKYFVSMQDDEGEYHLFVYDSAKGMWHREDDTQVISFCACHGDLFYIDYGDNQIKSVKGSGVPENDLIKWEAVTGIIGTDSPDKKYISRMDVRMSLKVGSRASFYAEYDSSGEWEHLFTMDGVNLRTFPVPIRPQRCDHLRLKIVGVGEAKIYSICKTTEQGSDS